MTVSENTIKFKGLDDLIKNLDKRGLNVSKNMAENVLKKTGRALEIGANVDSAIASRALKQLYLQNQKWLIFVTPEKDFTLENFHNLCFINRTRNRQIIPICTIRKY